jgi:hypothetical protein
LLKAASVPDRFFGVFGQLKFRGDAELSYLKRTAEENSQIQ